MRGSSPLTRGKRFTFERTSAGETAHPRSRGENSIMSHLSPPLLGSSPLTRGKRRLVGDCIASRWLIPAHAGKTRPCVSDLEAPAAHPRSRGENRSLVEIPGFSLGSSPLTRGKQSDGFVVAVEQRLIPAHAGKTKMTEALTVCPPAHPRSRGENPAPKSGGWGRIGSSPLTRGKRARRSASVRQRRLIPAHAGKTSRSTIPTAACAAHPRSRGENFHDLRHTGLTIGSSPLTRGKRLGGRGYATGGMAHPRSRGENAAAP